MTSPDRTTHSLGMGGHQDPHHGAKDEWMTPPFITEALGPFDLDPCTSHIRPWPTAKQHFTIFENGLVLPWHGYVWCNPPYGPQTWKWLDKMAEHNNGIALTFARTETAGFFESAWGKADAALFLRGRLFFHHVDGTRAAHNAGAPSVLLAYGHEAVHRLRTATSLLGAFTDWWTIR